MVDRQRRDKVKANHSATHLLHKALKDILGEHVSQRGSYVGEQILRFDFTHNKALQQSELLQIEQKINQIIRANDLVITDIMVIEEAKESGAEALFGEKYDSKVRVVSMGQDNFSKELCGGTHVARVGDIGVFKIISEGSIASGIRRIEAITGQAVINYIQDQQNILTKAEQLLKAPAKQLVNHLEDLLKNKKKLEKEISALKQKLHANISADDFIMAGDKKIMLKIMADLDAKEVRELALKFKQKYISQAIPVIIVLGKNNNKISVITIVEDNISSKISAVDLVQKIVPLLGGKGGGGKNNFAQGGGVNLDRLTEIRKYLTEIIF